MISVDDDVEAAEPRSKPCSVARYFISRTLEWSLTPSRKLSSSYVVGSLPNSPKACYRTGESFQDVFCDKQLWKNVLLIKVISVVGPSYIPQVIELVW